MLQGLCGMRLNTAGVVIGWLGVIGSFIVTILLATILGCADTISKHIAEQMQNKNFTVDEIHSVLVIACSIYLSIIVINLLSSAMLVWGTMKERHLMLLPWLINSGIGLVVSIIYDIALFSALVSYGGAAVPAIIVNILTLALQVYIYYGIYSLFKQIQMTREQQRPLINEMYPPVPAQTNAYPNYTKI